MISFATAPVSKSQSKVDVVRAGHMSLLFPQKLTSSVEVTKKCPGHTAQGKQSLKLCGAHPVTRAICEHQEQSTQDIFWEQ